MIDLSNFTMEEKVGQLFMVGFDGYEMTDDMFNLIVTYHVGGVCYFSRNLQEPKQVRDLSDQLQSHTKLDFPLFISIDQEGGLVNRISNDVVTSPSAMALGAIDNRVYTKRIAEAVAGDLRRMGINMNFAPVADINGNPLNPVIGTRSFGEDIRKVTKMTQDTIAGYEKHQLIPSIKHFPGHGDTTTDSHLDVPVIPHTLEEIQNLDLKPFVQAIANDIDTIMVSHLQFPAIDNENIASLSDKIITGLLRKQLAFNGLVITDCLEMDAVQQKYTIEDAAIRAIQAGADVVLISHTYEKQRKAIDAVIEAVKTGVISESRIDESLERILQLKAKRQIHSSPLFEADEGWRQRQFEFSKRLTDLSITIMKDDQALLPINKEENIVLFWPAITGSSAADDSHLDIESIGSFLRKDSKHITEYALADANLHIQQCEKADKIIIATHNILQDRKQKQLVQSLMDQFAYKTIAIATHSPYDIKAYPAVSTYIATYDPRATTMESTSRLLFGKYTNRARLPITIDRQLKRGYRYKKK